MVPGLVLSEFIYCKLVVVLDSETYLRRALELEKVVSMPRFMWLKVLRSPIFYLAAAFSISLVCPMLSKNLEFYPESTLIVSFYEPNVLLGDPLSYLNYLNGLLGMISIACISSSLIVAAL